MYSLFTALFLLKYATCSINFPVKCWVSPRSQYGRFDLVYMCTQMPGCSNDVIHRSMCSEIPLYLRAVVVIQLD